MIEIKDEPLSQIRNKITIDLEDVLARLKFTTNYDEVLALSIQARDYSRAFLDCVTREATETETTEVPREAAQAVATEASAEASALHRRLWSAINDVSVTTISPPASSQSTKKTVYQGGIGAAAEAIMSGIGEVHGPGWSKRVEDLDPDAQLLVVLGPNESDRIMIGQVKMSPMVARRLILVRPDGTVMEVSPTQSGQPADEPK